MLVSLIANLNAIALRNSAALGMMNAADNSLGLIRSAGASGVNFRALAQQDTKNSINMAKNQFNYMYASAWQKQCERRAKEEAKNHSIFYNA